MNDRDFDQVLDAFLELGPETAPDRVGAAARHEARETPQTMLPSWWPSWRLPNMNSTIRYGIGAVAVIVIALAGINYLAPNGLGGPGPTATPTSKPSPTVVPTVNPEAACTPLNPDAESMPIGRYCLDVPSPLKIGFTVPEIGWTPWIPANDYGAVLNGTAWGIGFLEIDNLYADPCHPEAGLLEPAIGPTADDLVAGLRAQSHYEVTDATGATIGGYSGQQFEISAVDEVADCRDTDSSWGVTPSGFAIDGSLVPTAERPVWLWVGDVDGTRLVIVRPLSALPSVDEWADGVRQPNRHAGDLTEADSIVASLRFNE